MLGKVLQIVLLLALAGFFTHFALLVNHEDDYPIINAHEHIASKKAASLYQSVAREYGITHTVILGSPESAIEPRRRGFINADLNNRRMLQLSLRHPQDYSLFATIDPDDPLKLDKLKNYILQGAIGLKLYSGHALYHTSPMDMPSMLPVFEFCERGNIPIMFHVNPALYGGEFEHILLQYPNLKVICPHFCLSTIRIDRFKQLMDRFPNLYVDTSFGFIEFFKEALLRFSAEPGVYRELFIRYQDRIVFGLDLVVNSESYKTKAWYEGMIQAYRDMLEGKEFTFEELPGRTLHGMNLDSVLLKKIYFSNLQHLLSQRSVK